jgi:hypothetical protein
LFIHFVLMGGPVTRIAYCLEHCPYQKFEHCSSIQIFVQVNSFIGPLESLGALLLQ